MRTLVWFKPTDLRVLDHPALSHAHAKGTHVVHVFCFDPRWTQRFTVSRPLQQVRAFGECEGEEGIQFGRMGRERCRFLVESVKGLRDRIEVEAGKLIVRVGKPEEEIPKIAEMLEIQRVVCHSEFVYEEKVINRRVEKNLVGCEFVQVHDHNTLVDMEELKFFPFDVVKDLPDTYTQFRKEVESLVFKKKIALKCLPVPKFKPCVTFKDGFDFGVIPELSSLCEQPEEKAELPSNSNYFKGGELHGLERIHEYIWATNSIKDYKETRNGLVGMNYSSKFSPWLALGCISPRYIMKEVRSYEAQRVKNDSTYWLWFELLWRDYFKFYGMKHKNEMFFLGGAQRNPNKKEWRTSMTEIKQIFESWKFGRTGYPFIDSNMRELFATGFMSNRGRQVVASFLVNDLQIDWRLGALHFEEHLLDHDPCSNYGNWNYVAGVGSDPREDRYFNVVKQATVYDPEAQHIKMWCPEIAHLKKDMLLDPTHMTSLVRQMYNVPLSKYPSPIVELKFKKFHHGTGKPGSSEYVKKKKR
jgi:deoxyribodipyrimidine photo-lyase